jgi:hypothetical protein
VIPGYSSISPKASASPRTMSAREVGFAKTAENRRLREEQARNAPPNLQSEPKGRSTVPRCEPSPDRLKRCTKCHEWLPIGCFHRRKGSPDFHATECRLCKKIRTITR